MLRVIISVCLAGLLLCSSALQAETENTKKFGPYEVSVSMFNSLFIDAEIAAIHKLVRAKDQTLINVSVVDERSGKTVSAAVRANAKNLMQQSKSIDFKEIDEPGAVYYIGALKHSNREIFHFDFEVHVEGEPSAYTFKMTKKLYTEQ